LQRWFLPERIVRSTVGLLAIVNPTKFLNNLLAALGSL
jgi:hypothetical protein